MAMASSLFAYVWLARPRQWVKNAFLVLPLFLTPDRAVDLTAWLAVGLGVLAFCLASSGVYVFNDWADRTADQYHPEKRHRPLAAGLISPVSALVYCGLLWIAAAAIGLQLYRVSALFPLILVGYIAINLLYSLRLKHTAILDVLLISAGFVLRVEAGAALIGVAPSVWIMLLTGLLALLLALGKRRDDLVRDLNSAHRGALNGYNKTFLDTAVAMVLGALLVGYLIYTADAAVQEKYQTTQLHWTSPFVLLGILRYLQILFVEEKSGSPTDILLRDRMIQAAVLGWAASFAWLVY